MVDTGDFYNSGLDEPCTAIYYCTFCGKQKEVIVTWDNKAHTSFPEDYAETICHDCGEFMDEIQRGEK